MSIIKRLYTTISASVDQLVGDIENHDALIDAAIREQRKKLAAARVQLKRLLERERQASGDIEHLQAKQQQWRERAVRTAGEDEAGALACLQQRHRIVEKIEQLQTHRRQYAEASHNMAADIGRCERELQDLSQKHALFRARQSSGEALNVINGMGGLSREDLCGCFERWDATLMAHEIGSPVDEVDIFEQRFVEEENREQLRRELDDLLSGGLANRDVREQGGASDE